MTNRSSAGPLTDTRAAAALSAIAESGPIGIMLREFEALAWVNSTLLTMTGTDRAGLMLAAQPDTNDSRLAELFGDTDRLSIDDGTGEIRWLKRMVAYPGPAGQRVDYFLDITREVRLAEVNRVLELRDAETGVLNAAAILSALDKEVSRTRRYGNPLTIIRVDAAAFANANAGSAQLKALAQELRAQLRWVDEVGRIDSCNLLLILPETPLCGAETLLETLQRNRLAADPDQNLVMFPSAPIVATWERGDDARRLLKRTGWTQEAAR